ncbi:PHO85 cyclin-1 [Coemansia javaensis]|uniref:PHO85 cyclin-1 n=1 Tax=Coemansia javaensis TaxID=2761396 RepID=A0A9W8LFB8_9FUNG|nr:PHO85 cyclin-1 [Coemansia javaensis]
MSAQPKDARGARPLHLNLSVPLTPYTLDAIQCEITKEMIAVIAVHARNVIPCTPAPALTAADRRPRTGSAERLPSPPTTPGTTLSSVPPLDTFITNLVLRSRVQAGTLVCTLVYLQRLRSRLPKEARGMECTCHRIFLATLIVAGKYLNDASPKNKYWARYSTVFTVAEVNLMEKQLLFLLDFDLRIDNADLNEAAAAFAAQDSKLAGPLTPTTPPTTAAPHPQAAAAGELPQAYSQYKAQHPAEAARLYPATLGLNRQSGALDVGAASAAAVAAAAAAEIQSSGTCRAATATARQLADTASASKRQTCYEGADTHQHQHQRRAASGIVHKAPPAATSALRTIPADEKLGPLPSPKKRAVSRGQHGNIPHPSPVYHCRAAGPQSGTSGPGTAHSACFFQPLEQASIKYASSRFQQQRYDPLAAPGCYAARSRTRASISIPSFRAVSAEAGAARPLPSTGASPTATGSTASGRPPKARHILRHQSTLPDFHKLGPRDEMRTPLSMCPETRVPSASALPALPLPARLASGGSHAHLEYSPVNTLVYEPSPASAATIGHHHHGSARPEHAHRYSRQPSSRRSALELAPQVSALPAALADVQRVPEAAEPAAAVPRQHDYDTDRTLSYAQNGLQHCCSAQPAPLQHPYHQHHSHHHSHSHKNPAGSGWQLKTKILHPLSTWFRSSRHQGGHGAPAPALPALSPGLARDPRCQPLHGCDVKSSGSS